jgi:hypothetical protein
MISDINNCPEVYYPEKNIFTGIIENIFNQIGTTNKYYVEFGFTDVDELYDNTTFLKRHHGWNGLWMDVSPNTKYNKKKNPAVKIHKITAENINDLFELYNVPEIFDLLIIDVDFNDLWIWKALNEKYKPRMLMIEYNLFVPPGESKVVAYDPDFVITTYDQYFGGSFDALLKLSKEKNYQLIGCSDANMLFVPNDLVDGNFIIPDDIYTLYIPPNPNKHTHPKSNMTMIDY